MSLTQIAYLEKSNVPNREQLEASIHRLGYEVKIDESYQAFNCTGFLPCALDGMPAGIETAKRFPNCMNI